MITVHVEAFSPNKGIVGSFTAADVIPRQELVEEVNKFIITNAHWFTKDHPRTEELRWSFEGSHQGHYITKLADEWIVTG